jgi:GNAT superfamily N-acetyltransferase
MTPVQVNPEIIVAVSAPNDVPAQAPIGYELDDDPARVDRDAVWAFLSTQAYWGRWRDRQTVNAQIDGAWRVVGAYEQRSGRLVGFARALSDGLALAYLADLFVLPDHRGHRLGHHLVSTMIDEGPGVRFRWLLHTSDAHGLYTQYGFSAPDATLLERRAQLDPVTPTTPTELPVTERP